MKHIIFFIFLFSMNVNCIHDDPLQDGDSRIVWKSKFINMENASPSKFDPIIDDKKIYISRWDGEKNNAIISFDKLNGGVDWTWKGTRIKNTGKEVQYTIYSLIKYENILVGSDKKN